MNVLPPETASKKNQKQAKKSTESKKKMGKPKKTKADIGEPINFEYISGTNKQIQDIFKLAGVTIKDLARPECRAVIDNFIQVHLVLDPIESNKKPPFEKIPIVSKKKIVRPKEPPPPPPLTRKIAVLQNDGEPSEPSLCRLPPAPPPPPPPAMTRCGALSPVDDSSSVPSKATAQSESNDFLLEIQKGFQLKPIENTQTAKTDPLSDMLSEIRNGFKLTPVEKRPVTLKPLTRQDSNVLSIVLRKALDTIKKAAHSSEEDGADNNDEVERSSWQDDMK